MTDDHLLPRRTAPDWRTIAACRDADTAVFFTPERTLEALAICDGCPVKAPCAKAGRMEEGVWGGRPEGARYITCAECGRGFVRVNTAGVAPIVCGPRCRKDRDLRNARRARERRMAS